MLLVFGAALIFLIGSYAPPSLMQHFIVFVLSVFCWISSDLECQPLAAHSSDGCNQCYLVDYYIRSITSDRLNQLFSNPTRYDFGVFC